MRQKDPILRVVKRENSSLLVPVLAYLSAIAAALLIGAALLAFMGVEPLGFFQKMLTLGIPGNKYPARILENYIKLFVPLLLTSLALALAFRMRFWNIGGEGQFIMGAVSASAVALLLGERLSGAALVPLMCLCGLLGGGLYGLLAAVFRVRFGTNETLLTLMLNYIALYFLSFLGETKGDWNFFLDPASARPKFVKFPDSAAMFTIPIGTFRLNVSLLAAILLCVLLYFYLRWSKQGYELAVVGDSPNTARYAGMHVGTIVLRTIFLSAAMIGLAGAFYVSSSGTLSTSVTNDVGWTGVTVAWLAKLNTLGIVAASLLITVLQFGCQNASTTYSSIDANFADLIQGIILFAVLAADFFTRFRLVFRGASGQEKQRKGGTAA